MDPLDWAGHDAGRLGCWVEVLHQPLHPCQLRISPSISNHHAGSSGRSSYDDIEFVPFSIEVGGVWGPAARRFFDGCLDAANTDRDIDFYHWSSQSFGDFWKDALSVLMARERARIGLAASKGDWPRRIAEYARDDQEDAAAYAANY